MARHTVTVHPAVDEHTLVLAIETSCDETAAAVVEGGHTVRSSVVSSQVDIHARFGGVVPEVAGRAHESLVTPVVAEALVEAGVADGRIDAVAATVGPGLIGSLLVGVSSAKALSLAWKVPFVGVNHLEGHLYAALLDDPELELPAVVLLVSGGHTMLVHMVDHGRYELIGTTLDDAAGEAFDKVARYMGLGYPGGPAIEALAREGDPAAIAFPRAMPDSLDFSFSGLKTAVVNHVRRHEDVDTADVAASFQQAVVDVLVDKTLTAARSRGVRSVALAGGVAANGTLRAVAEEACVSEGLRLSKPSRENCTDNAAMIGAAAWHRLALSGPSELDMGADPGLSLPFAG